MLQFAEGREELIEWLKLLKETITDIRKVYRSGATDSVMDKYRQYIDKGRVMGKRQGGKR